MSNPIDPRVGPRFYINDGSGFFTDDMTRLPAILNTPPTVYGASVLLDVDQDGDLDLVFINLR